MSLIDLDREDSPPVIPRRNDVVRLERGSADPQHGRSAGVVLGCWLFIVFVVAITSRIETLGISSISRVALAAAVLWPLVYFMFGNVRFMPGPIKRGSMIAIVLFALFSLTSLFASADINASVPYLLLTLGALFIALQFNANLKASSLETGLRCYALLMAVSLVWVIVSNFVPGERLWVTAAGYNPNSLALVDLSAIVAAMAYRNVLIRCCILAVPVVATVLTDSRASGLGTIIALSVIILVRLKAAERSTRNFMFIIMGVVILSAIYFQGQLSASFSDFFQLQDEYRGLDTGATGRSAAWSATWRLFVENPIFGVGFRAHEARLGVASSSHNGYLALLAEIGLVGFTSAIYLVATGAAFLYERVASKDAVFCYSILFGLVAGYLVVAMFERYLLNVGNPTSLLFLVAITATCQNTADRSNAYDGGDARRHSILP